jgi:hypothetical protein
LTFAQTKPATASTPKTMNPHCSRLLATRTWYFPESPLNQVLADRVRAPAQCRTGGSNDRAPHSPRTPSTSSPTTIGGLISCHGWAATRRHSTGRGPMWRTSCMGRRRASCRFSSGSPSRVRASAGPVPCVGADRRLPNPRYNSCGRKANRRLSSR